MVTMDENRGLVSALGVLTRADNPFRCIATGGSV